MFETSLGLLEMQYLNFSTAWITYWVEYFFLYLSRLIIIQCASPYLQEVQSLNFMLWIVEIKKNMYVLNHLRNFDLILNWLSFYLLCFFHFAILSYSCTLHMLDGNKVSQRFQSNTLSWEELRSMKMIFQNTFGLKSSIPIVMSWIRFLLNLFLTKYLKKFWKEENQMFSIFTWLDANVLF